MKKNLLCIMFQIMKKEIIKVYKNFDDKLYLMEKLKTTRNLLKYVKETKIQELIRPHGIAMINKNIIGTIYPEIDAYTARVYLSLSIIPIKLKIEILKKLDHYLIKLKIQIQNIMQLFQMYI